jgi:hypothetical protein
MNNLHAANNDQRIKPEIYNARKQADTRMK